jgi:2,4-dienoyl-CoA reductase-like NADH-dependent reductase (Old Yellow Enzyme family)
MTSIHFHRRTAMSSTRNEAGAALGWYVYHPGEQIEVELDGVWKRARFLAETMSPSHKGMVEILDGGQNLEVWRDRMRPLGEVRGRVADQAPGAQPAVTPEMDALFQPFAVKSLRLPSRIVMSPMTRSFGHRGVPDPQTAAYYRRRAEGGAGLVLTEGLVVPQAASEFSKYVPHLYGEQALAVWSEVVRQVHEVGGHIIPQLWHAGTCRDMTVAAEPDKPSLSPSGFDPLDRPSAKMEQADIDAVIEAHAQAAENAQRLGFDGVEIHAGHGYVIDAFFWAGMNRRQDGYGGDLRQRTRFACEIVREVRRRVGEDFPLFMRISQWKLQDYGARNAETPQQLADWVEPLAEAGVDLFDCSQRRFDEAEFEGSDLNLAGWVKKITGRPTMTVGSVGLSGSFLEGAERPTDTHHLAQTEGLRRLIERLERGEFDLVAVGRGMLNNPDWARRVRSGTPLRPFDHNVLASLI